MLLIISCAYLILSLIFYFTYLRSLPTVIKEFNDKSYGTISIFFLIVTITAIKLIYSTTTYFVGDMYSFSQWMHTLFDEGFAGYYSKYGISYPPLHMFIVYITGFINSKLGFSDLSAGQITLFKFPSILCDAITAYLIYRIAKKNLSCKLGTLLAAFYLLNPAIIINSTIWGQVDSIYTLFIVLMCYMVSEKKLRTAYFIFAISMLFKYQALIFTPILIYGIIDQVFLVDFSIKKLINHLLNGIAAILFLFTMHFPFIFGNGNALENMSTIFNEYKGSLTAYPFASLNAYNFWTLCGQNLQSQDKTFMMISYKTFGTISILALIIFSLYIALKIKEDKSKYTLIASFIISTMFIFSVRMHERYLYPVIILLIVTYMIKPVKDLIFIGSCFSIVQFLNVSFIMFNLNTSSNKLISDIAPRIISGITVLIWIYFMYVIVTKYLCKIEKHDII